MTEQAKERRLSEVRQRERHNERRAKGLDEKERDLDARAVSFRQRMETETKALCDRWEALSGWEQQLAERERHAEQSLTLSRQRIEMADRAKAEAENARKHYEAAWKEAEELKADCNKRLGR